MSQITKINGVPIANTSVSAFTYGNNVLTIGNTNGTSYSELINTMTGLTINGNLTATTISATTYYNLPLDVYVTGGTYSNGTASFTNNTGGTFNVSGFSSGSTLSKIVIDFGFDATYATTSTSFAQAPMTITILSASTYNSSLTAITAVVTCDISQSTAGIAGEFDLFDLTDGVTVTSSATAFVSTDGLKSSASFSIPSTRFNHVFRVRIRRTGGVGSDTMRIREAQLTLTLT